MTFQYLYNKMIYFNINFINFSLNVIDLINYKLIKHIFFFYFFIYIIVKFFMIQKIFKEEDLFLS